MATNEFDGASLDERRPGPPRPATAGTAAAGAAADHADTVVVGVDASVGARQAVAWAADEATRRHARLRLVHAWAPPASGHPAIPDDLDADLVFTEQGLLDRIVADLSLSHPALPVSTRVIRDRAVHALGRESKDAVLTVIGSDGASRPAGALLGSVASAITSNNPAPVAIVHSAAAQNAAGPVVVGIDASGNCDDAIAFAFEAAALHRTDLVAVHAWTDKTIGGPYSRQPLVVAPSIDIQEEQSELLAQRLSRWNDKYPDVTVRLMVVARRPVPALLELAAGAQLLVVGSHGHGSFARMLLGSTGRSLIAHCPAPVVIIRPVRSAVRSTVAAHGPAREPTSRVLTGRHGQLPAARLPADQLPTAPSS